jgi:hypothetical protein
MQEVRHFDTNGCSLLWKIQSRIEHCRRLKAEALTPDEEGAWEAEASGLVDAFLGLDRTDLQRDRHPSHVSRYAAGLQDGRTIMQLLLEQYPSQPREEYRGRSDGSSDGNIKASPDTSLHHRHVA